jgi:hypothetical protein
MGQKNMKFKILVGEYFVPKSGSGEYCFLGVQNLETKEMGTLLLAHTNDLLEVPQEIKEEASWIVSCYLPEEYKNKSCTPDASGKVNVVKKENLQKEGVIEVTTKEIHTEEFGIELFEKLPIYSKAKAMEKTLIGTKGCVRTAVRRVANWLSSKGKEYKGLARAVFRFCNLGLSLAEFVRLIK